MEMFQTLIILVFFATILVGVAQKFQIPYPILLVIGGMAIGFIPNPHVMFSDPNLILVIVLPPILYYAAFSISFREFAKNRREIFSLALGLVIITTLAIGAVFKWLFPEVPWALAFAFGAIVSPPDSIAATTILKRFAISPRLLAILEGESLVNDASALVLYKLAVTALLTGTFSLADASIEFVKIASGGIAVGAISGLILHNFSRKYLDPVTGVLFSIAIGYVTYILAQFFDVSGVLAVVVNGLIGAHILAKHHSSLRRILGFSFWDIFIILINCFVFVLIGSQLRNLVVEKTFQEIALYVAYSFLITLTLILVRLIWVYARSLVAYFKSQKRNEYPKILREATVIGWSGMRGIVSLVAAFALPNSIEGRNEVIFITFVVILITLILPSSTLAYLIKLMKIDHHVNHHEAHHARKRLVQVADESVHQMQQSQSINEREYQFLKNYFNSQRYVFEISDSHLKKMTNLELARLKVLKAQRLLLVQMWEAQEIDDRLFRELEHELDIEESHRARAKI